MAASDNYAPGVERVQVTASPNLATEQARYDPGADRMGQLMRALNVAAPDALKLSEKIEATHTVEGTQAARGMTLEEQGRKIASGELLASHSPSYVAAVQHVYGQNLMDTQQRTALDKIARGELTFPTTEAVGAYLTENRNAALSGQSKYTTAGFDKSFDQFANAVNTANSHKTNAAYVEEAQRSADEYIHNALARVQTPEFKGTPREKAAFILNEFDFGQATKLIPREQSKDTLKSLLNSVAETGDTALMKELLESPTMDGHRLASIVGGSQARLFAVRATGVDDANQRQRVDIDIRPFAAAARKGELNPAAFDAFIQKNEKWLTTDTIMSLQDKNMMVQNRLAGAADRMQLSNNAQVHNSGVQAAVAAAVENGTYARLPAQQQMSPHDNALSALDTEPLAIAAIDAYAQRTKMAFGDHLSMYTAAGLTNPAWKKVAATGMANLASVGKVYEGKPPGVLNPQGEEGIEMLRKLKREDPSSVATYAGSQGNVRDFETIEMLIMTGGAGNLNAAAGIVNTGKYSGITDKDFSLKQAQIAAAVSAMASPHWFSGMTNAASTLFGGNQDVNESEITAHIRSGAEARLRAGLATTGQQAVDQMRSYAASPQVTTVINNTRYYNTQLPAVPQGASVADYVNKFITNKVAKEYGGPAAPFEISANANPPSRVIALGQYAATKATAALLGTEVGATAAPRMSLHVEPGGNFTALIGGLPATTPTGKVLVYTKREIEGWISESYLADMRETNRKRNRDMARKAADAPFKEMRDASPEIAWTYAQ